jgi:acyl carrier protein
MEESVIRIAKSIEEIADIPANEIFEDSLIMDDLELSSIEIMAVVADIERYYSIRISETELMSVRSVADLARIVDMKRK